MVLLKKARPVEGWYERHIDKVAFLGNGYRQLYANNDRDASGAFGKLAQWSGCSYSLLLEQDG
jgi:hypothetical protein